MPREPLFTRPFLLAFLANFIHALAFHMYLHLPGFLTGLGADEFMIGSIAAVASGAAIALRPAIGRLMDLRGRRIVMLGGGVLNCAALALYLTVDSIGPWIFIVRTLHGIAQAALFSAFFTYAADVIPESRRTEGIGLFGISGMLPIGLGPSLGDWLLARAEYADLFVVSIALAACSLVASLPIHDRPIEDASPSPTRPFFGTLAQPNLVPLWFIGGVCSTAIAGAFIFMKSYVLVIELGAIGAYFNSYALAAISLRVVAGWLPDRVGVKRIFFPALVLLSLGLLLIAFADSPAELALAGFLCGIGHGYYVPILTSMIVNRARASERGTAISISTALFDVGFLVGGPLLGGVIRGAGYFEMYCLAAGLAFTGMLVFAVWDRAR